MPKKIIPPLAITLHKYKYYWCRVHDMEKYQLNELLVLARESNGELSDAQIIMKALETMIALETI